MRIDILGAAWQAYQQLFVEVADEYLGSDDAQFWNLQQDPRLVAFIQAQGWAVEDMHLAEAESIVHAAKLSRPFCMLVSDV